MSSTRIKTQEIFQAFERETENIWRWAFPGLFLLICVFSIVQMEDKILPKSGFELRISGDGSDHSHCPTLLNFDLQTAFVRVAIDP